MATGSEPRKARLSIDIDPELRSKIKSAAAAKDQTVRDYVVAILRRAVATPGHAEEATEELAWAQLSARSFTRDWDSEEDQVYDALGPPGS